MQFHTLSVKTTLIYERHSILRRYGWGRNPLALALTLTHPFRHGGKESMAVKTAPSLDKSHFRFLALLLFVHLKSAGYQPARKRRRPFGLSNNRRQNRACALFQQP